MEWNVIIGLVCTVLGAVIGYVTFIRNGKKESRDEGKESGAALSELGYIKSGVDDLKAEFRDMRKTNAEIVQRLAAVESSAKQAHHRLDRLENKE